MFGVFQGLFLSPGMWRVEGPRCELGTLWCLLFHALLNAHWRGQGVCKDPKKGAHLVPLAQSFAGSRAGTRLDLSLHSP